MPELAPGDVFFIVSDRTTYTERRNDDILNWVESGGHLIVAAQTDYLVDENEPVTDKLLAEVGAVQVRLGDEDLSPQGGMEAQIEQSGPTLRFVSNRRYRLRVDTNSWNSLAWDALGDAIVHTHLGRGAITVLSDGNAFDNGTIARYDHAEILWRLVNLTAATRVWIEHSSDMPMLPLWLWQHAPEAILTAVLLLITLLWRACPRFGPVVDLAPTVRRSLLEHIDASGRFFWHQHRRLRLLKALRSSVLNTAMSKHPGLAGLEPAQRCQRLAAIIEIPYERIENALYGRLIADRRAFVETVRVLASIRKCL